MNPVEFSAALRRIATAIDNSKNPSKELVLRDLERLIIAAEPNSAGITDKIKGLFKGKELDKTKLEGPEIEQILNLMSKADGYRNQISPLMNGAVIEDENFDDADKKVRSLLDIMDRIVDISDGLVKSGVLKKDHAAMKSYKGFRKWFLDHEGEAEMRRPKDGKEFGNAVLNLLTDGMQDLGFYRRDLGHKTKVSE